MDHRTARAGAPVAAALLVLLVLPPPVAALDYSLVADYDVEYTSNARRVAGEGESDMIHRPGLSAAATHAEGRATIDLRYSIYRRIYQDDSFDSDTPAQGSARLSWDAIPERLSFFVEDRRRESEIRTEGQSIPSNLQQTSETAAGALLRADFFSSHYATLTYRFADNDADRTSTDSERHNVQAAYVIPIGPTDTLQLRGAGTDTDFDDPMAPDYQSVTASVAYNRRGPESSVSGHVGYTSIDRELGRDQVEGMVGGLSLTRRLSARSSLRFSYTLDYQDNSLASWRPDEFLDAVGGEDLIGEDVIVDDTDLAEVYRVHFASLGLVTRLGVNRFMVTGTGSKQDYESPVGRDAERFGVLLRAVRPLRPRVTGSVDLQYHRDDFQQGGNNDEYRAGLALNWDATPRLSLGSYVSYFDRQASGDGGATVDGWTVGLRVAYFLLGYSEPGAPE